MAKKIEDFNLTCRLKIVEPMVGQYQKALNNNTDLPDYVLEAYTLQKETVKNLELKFTSEHLNGFDVNDIVEVVLSGRRELSVGIMSAMLVDNGEKDVLVKIEDEIYELEGQKIYVPKNINTILRIAKEMLKAGKSKFANILLTGNSGFGKTTLAKVLSKLTGLDIVKYDIGTIEQPLDFIGSRELKNGETQFVIDPRIKRIEQGNCILQLDEINRAKPEHMNILNPLLDNVRRIQLNGYEIIVGDNVLVMANCNEGWGYTGTSPMDASLRSRFSLIADVIELPVAQETELIKEKLANVSMKNKEQTIAKMMSTITELRKLHSNGELPIEISTRKTEYVCELIATVGLTPRAAFEIVYTGQVKEKEDSASYTKIGNMLTTKLGKLEYEYRPSKTN